MTLLIIEIHLVNVRGDEPVEVEAPRILDDPEPLRDWLLALEPRPTALAELSKMLLEVPNKARAKIPGFQDLLDNCLWLERTNPGSTIALAGRPKDELMSDIISRKRVLELVKSLVPTEIQGFQLSEVAEHRPYDIWAYYETDVGKRGNYGRVYFYPTTCTELIVTGQTVGMVLELTDTLAKVRADVDRRKQERAARNIA